MRLTRKIKLRHKEKQRLEAEKAKPRRASKSERPSVHTANDELNEVAAAAFLGKSVSTLQNRRSLGKPPKFKRVGRSVFYDLSDLEEYQNSRTKTGTIISE